MKCLTIHLTIRIDIWKGGDFVSKRIGAFLMAILLLSTLSLSVAAASPRALMMATGLSFSGTTANCQLTVTSDTTADKLVAQIKLWNGNTCLRTWNVQGNGAIMFYDTHAVTRYKTYTLTADVTVNGVAQPTVSKSAKCT